MFSGSDEPAVDTAEAKPEASAPQPSLYVGMPRPSCSTAGGQRIGWQIKIQLMVRGAADETLAKQNIP